MGLLVPAQKYAHRWINQSGPAADLAISDPATPHTKSGYSEITSGLAFDIERLLIWPNSYGTSGVDSSALFDIALGGAGSESILLSDLFAGACRNRTSGISQAYDFPVAIPANTRISARMQGARTNGTLRLSVAAYGGGSGVRPQPVEKLTAYGVDAAASNGTAVTSGNSSAEAGSWTTIGTASEHHEGLLMMPCAPASATVAANIYAFDLAIDNDVIIENVGMGTGSDESQTGPWPNDICWVDVPSGAALKMRASCNGTADTVRGIVYGVN